MKHSLYSELRTLYETTPEDPHTFRITIQMKDLIDERVLRQAVDQTMVRYPYFRVRLLMENGRLFFVDNPEPLPTIHTNARILLGSEQTSGHLLCFCYSHNTLHIDVYHGLTDGGGFGPLIQTLLYYYCSAFYGRTLSSEGIRLYDDPVTPAEWEDPAAVPLAPGKKSLVRKWEQPAFQLADGGIASLTRDCIVFNLRIPEKEFMRFNFSNDGSPAVIAALLLARAIDELHPNAPLPPVIAMCVNQRKALRAPFAHQSLVGDVRLPFTDRIKKLPFSTQSTCFRGMVTLQSDTDMVLDDIRDYQALVAHLETMTDPRDRQRYCVRKMEELSRCVTAVVSYAGKNCLGDAEKYIHQFDVRPSTALPSTHVPLSIEMSALNGYFFVDFIQYFHAPDYFSIFVRQLREVNIDYDVLEVQDAGFPHMELPI